MTEKITRHNAHMIKKILSKSLGCTVIGAAVSSLVNTRAANTVIMKVAENAAEEYGFDLNTQHTSNGMQFVVGSSESIEVAIKVADAAKMEAVNGIFDCIKESGLDKEQIQKALLDVVIKQLKK